jgi:hypothetical protein
MKKLIIGLASTITLVNCERKTLPDMAAPPLHAPDTSRTVASEANHASLPVGKTIVPIADSLTVPMRAMLQHFDFTDLWKGQRHETATPVMDGFFGDDHRRIAFVFAEVKQDALQLGLFHVRGKNRFQRLTTPFAGTIQLTTSANHYC